MKTLRQRIAAKVDVSPTGCWVWVGSRDGCDYGVIHIGGSAGWRGSRVCRACNRAAQKRRRGRAEIQAEVARIDGGAA